MRLLFTSVAGLGHLQPVLPVALAARRAGHDVLVAAPADTLGPVAALGLAREAAGLDAPDRMAAYLRTWPEAAAMTGAERAAFMFPHLFGHAANVAIGDFLRIADAFAPDIIVSGQAELCGSAIAHSRAIPNVTHAFGSTVPPESIQLAAEVAVDMWSAVGLAPITLAGCFDHLYIDIYPPSLRTNGSAHIPRRALLRPESVDGGTAGALPPAVERLVASGRRLIYLTFGTVFNVNDTFASAVEAAAATGAGVVVTVGPTGDPTAFGPQPDHVVVERYVSQSLLLPHLSVVASHAGSGTLLAALAAAKPQLCMPQAADQFRNADALERAAAGLALIGDAATPTAIRGALERLLVERAFADAAARIADEIRDMPSPDDVVDAITALAHP